MLELSDKEARSVCGIIQPAPVMCEDTVYRRFSHVKLYRSLAESEVN